MINNRNVLVCSIVAVVIPVAALVLEAGDRESRFPSPEWARTTDWKSAGTSRDRLDAYDAWLRDHGGLAWAAVVIMDGYLIYGGRGARCTIWQKNHCGSIRKALQSTVLGAALYQGKLKSIDENAMPYWKDPYVTPYPKDRLITFRQFAQYHDRWNEAAPAGTFHYNNGGATAAGACIAGLFRDVRGPRPEGIAEVARKEVAEKIGANWDLWNWEADFNSKPGDSGPQLEFDSSVYELAKLGYLWLNRGRWKDTRIFGEDSSTRKRRFRTGMARLQVGQKSRLASKSSKSLCCSGGVIGIGTPQACLASRTIILPKFWPSSNAGNARTTPACA